MKHDRGCWYGKIIKFWQLPLKNCINSLKEVRATRWTLATVTQQWRADRILGPNKKESSPVHINWNQVIMDKVTGQTLESPKMLCMDTVLVLHLFMVQFIDMDTNEYYIIILFLKSYYLVSEKLKINKV